MRSTPKDKSSAAPPIPEALRPVRDAAHRLAGPFDVDAEEVDLAIAALWSHRGPVRGLPTRAFFDGVRDVVRSGSADMTVQDFVGTIIYGRAFLQGDGLPGRVLCTWPHRVWAIAASLPVWCGQAPDVMVSAGFLPRLDVPAVDAREWCISTFVRWCKDRLVPAFDGATGERHAQVREAIEAAHAPPNYAIPDPIEVTEDEAKELWGTFVALSDLRLPLTDEDRVFEPVWTLAQLLARRVLGPASRLDIPKYHRCFDQSLASVLNTLGLWVPAGWVAKGRDGRLPRLDRRFRKWITSVGEVIERDSTLHLGDSALTRANVLAMARLRIDLNGEGFFAGPDAFAAGLRKAVELAAPWEVRDHGAATRDTAGLVHLLRAEGLSSSRMFFVGDDGRLRINHTNIRDHLRSTKARESRPHAAESFGSIDKPIGSGDGTLADLIAAPEGPLPEIEAVEQARGASAVREAFDAIVAARLRRAKCGSARECVLENAWDLGEGSIGISELARKTGFAKSSLSSAWSKEMAAIAKNPELVRLANCR